jgi:DNA-binding winged helix-turn-helix (wHTH) protein
MGEQYLIGDLTVDTGNNTVNRRNETITLSPRSFQLLVALARRAPNVVSRQELLETVWPGEYVNDETLSQRVRVLRKSLGDLDETPKYISSVRDGVTDWLRLSNGWKSQKKNPLHCSPSFDQHHR